MSTTTFDIPGDIAGLPQFVTWDWSQTETGKPTKVPANPLTGRRASTARKETWGTLEAARARQQQEKLPGVGFVFTALDPFAGIDLDKCRDPATGAIESWASDIIRLLDSYAEISPSGTGVHVLVRGTIQSAIKTARVEIYDRGRYFTLTGERVPGTSERIESRQDELDRLCAQLRPMKAERPVARHSGAVPGNLDDATLIEKARAAKNSRKFCALWDGDTSAYGADDSRADAALCCILAFWTGGDAARINHLFRQSGLMRTKWDRADYRDRTIAYGIEHGGAYDPSYAGNGAILMIGGKLVDPSTGEVLDGEITVPPVVGEAITDTKPRMRPLTDLGNAERLIDRFGATMRYVIEPSKWAVFNGDRWEIDSAGEAQRRAYITIRGIYREAGDEESHGVRTDLAKHAVKSEAAARIAAMVDLARWIEGTPVKITDFDRDPLSLACENGIVDLRTGILRPHSPDALLLKRVKAPYDPSAQCPLWERFLGEAMAPHPEQIDFLRRAIGYSLTADVREEVFFLLYGAGSNGKGVFTETVQALFAEYAQQADIKTLMARQNDGGATPDVAALAGVRLVLAGESEDGERFNEAKVKALTGGDTITGRFLFQNPFTFRPTHKLWLATNHKPTVRGMDDGFWRRILLIPFDVTFDGARKDTTLKARLRAEMPGILAWAVRGCIEWQRDGLGVPKDVQDATNGYRDEMNVFGAFLRDCCEIDNRYWVPTADLYKAYAKWCDESGEFAEKQTSFGKRLREQLFTDERRSVRGWRGLRLTDRL